MGDLTYFLIGFSVFAYFNIKFVREGEVKSPHERVVAVLVGAIAGAAWPLLLAVLFFTWIFGFFSKK